ncbi:MAG TPA: FlgO family outer membrane protein [Thermoanaerobaculia bacterium]|nr:FlgO family outer membrane protein [Thermoanaerobaculia bacterium]
MTNATALSVEKRLYRFDGLLVDPVRRVLLREGEPVPITPKAFSILLVLIENRGEVVAKEELIRQVWASSYVSDANLTQNISSLRKALGERAGDPRYVVTVPGQGYTFAAPVELEEELATPSPFPPPPALSSAPEPLPEPTVTFDLGSIPGIPDRGSRPRLRIALGLAVLALVLALALAVPRLTRGPLALPEELGSVAPLRRPSVAVLGFRDLSQGEDTRWLASALAEMLTTELSAGGQVRVISRENVARARAYVDIQTSGTLAGASLPRIRSIVAADRVVVGTFVALPGGADRRIRLDVRVLRSADGEVLASLSEMGKESELFDLVNRAGAQLRQVLGYARPSPGQARAARALRPSDTEAMRLYSEGLDRLRDHDAPRALALLERAVQAEPESAVIRSAHSQALEMLGYEGPARDEAKRAVELASSLPREVRLGLQARLHALSHEWERASGIYRTLWTFYPDNLEYGLQLATTLARTGRAREALETVAAVRKLPSGQGEDPRIDVLEARIAWRLSDLDRTWRAASSAVAKSRRSGETLILAQALIYQGDALLLKGQTDRAVAVFREARQLAEKERQPYLVGMALANLGAALQARGDLAGAEAVYWESLAIAERLGTGMGISSQYQLLGILHQQKGELTEARDLLEKALVWQARIGDRMAEGRSHDAIGMVLAAQGDLVGARQKLEKALELGRAFGNRSDEAVSLIHLGEVLERQGDLAEALKRYEQAFAIFRTVGEPGQAAKALVESANAMSRLGDLAGARRRLKHALQSYRRAGDRLGMAEVLDRLSGMEYRTGDVAASRRLSERGIQIAEETGSDLLLLEALRRIGRADWAGGRLAEARLSLERALRLSLQGGGGEGTETMGIRLDLVRLSLSEERYEEAASLAREAADWYRSRNMAGSEAQGMSLLAEALLYQGKPAEAREAAERARVRAESSQDRETRVLVAARLARVDAAGGFPADFAKAVRDLRPRVREAQEEGYVNAALQARLALGEILLASGDATGRNLLLEVRKDAGNRGFAVLARRAEKALQTGGSLPGWIGWKGGRKTE